MEVLWSQRVEGDAFRQLVIESDRVLVSTGKQTLVVSRVGDVIDRYEPRLLGWDGSRLSVWLNEHRYELAEGHLVEFDAKGSQTLRAGIPIHQLEGTRECFGRLFAESTLTVAEWTDYELRRWWQGVGLVADSARGRLLAFGGNVPWIAAIRTDGGIEWALLSGSVTDCCNWAEVVAGDGTLAHFSSCGRRMTFVTAGGQIVSAHDVADPAGYLGTNGRAVAYVTLLGEGIAAYRPVVGLAGTLEIPRLEHAQVEQGIIYAVIDDLSDGFMLKAIQEPT